MSWPTIDPADVPAAPHTATLRLEPLHPRHNRRDHAAWMSSIDHIHATPGFQPGVWGGDSWPYEMALEANRADLEMHWDEFRRGVAYAYTVLDPHTDDVIGCVYIDPDEAPLGPDGVRADAMVRSWVRASHAHLDGELARVVGDWLASSWPFAGVRWPGRP
ncbi:MAG: hypothetical protein U0Q03_00535 [Acidimicrobiales bacterium]